MFASLHICSRTDVVVVIDTTPDPVSSITDTKVSSSKAKASDPEAVGAGDAVEKPKKSSKKDEVDIASIRAQHAQEKAAQRSVYRSTRLM